MDHINKIKKKCCHFYLSEVMKKYMKPALLNSFWLEMLTFSIRDQLTLKSRSFLNIRKQRAPSVSRWFQLLLACFPITAQVQAPVLLLTQLPASVFWEALDDGPSTHHPYVRPRWISFSHFGSKPVDGITLVSITLSLTLLLNLPSK